MNDTINLQGELLMDLFSGLVNLLYLLKLGGSIRPPERPNLGTLRFERLHAAAWRGGWIIPLLTGMGLAWAAHMAAGAGFPAAAVLIASALSIHRWSRGDKKGDGPEILAFLARLQDEVESGADFYEGLGTAARELPAGRRRSAVQETLELHAERQTAPACLRPFSRLGGVMGELAADALRANGPAIRFVVESVTRRAISRWDRGGRRRALAARAADLGPPLTSAAAGAAAFEVGALIGAPALLAGSLFLIALFAFRRLSIGAAWRRLLVLGSGLAAAALMLPLKPIPSNAGPIVQVRTFNPAPPVTPRSDRLPAMPPPQPSPSKIPLPAPPDRERNGAGPTCRVTTGHSEGWAHVRSAPGMDGAVLYYAAEGEVLEPGGFHGAWLSVRRRGEAVGWIYAALCAEE